MSYAQLLEPRNRVDAALVAAKVTEELRAKIEALAAKSGLTLYDILDTKSSSGNSKLKGSKVAVKYRNPKDAAQTWSGRGRQPKWLVAALKKGEKIESFLV